MSELSIRVANSSDVSALRACEQGVVKAERPMNDDLIDGHIEYYDLESLVASENACVLVVEDGDGVVGCGHVSLKRSKVYLQYEQQAYLGLLYVDPNYRGQGVIQRVMDELVAWSKARGVSNYYLDVYPDNPSAIRAYEKYGFRPSMLEMKMNDDR